MGRFVVQVKLLCWKRMLEFQAAPSEPLKVGRLTVQRPITRYFLPFALPPSLTHHSSLVTTLTFFPYISPYLCPSPSLQMCIALLFFALIILLEQNLLKGLPPCVLEFFLVPIAFWPFIQRMVVQITSEKANRLEEAMKSMGLYQAAYYLR
jgi:hypothetical protein